MITCSHENKRDTVGLKRISRPSIIKILKFAICHFMSRLVTARFGRLLTLASTIGLLLCASALSAAEALRIYCPFLEPTTIATWLPYQIKLRETNGWRIGSGSGPAPTTLQFLTVLSNLHSVEIYLERPTQFFLDTVNFAGLAESSFASNCTTEGWICRGCSSATGNPPGCITTFGPEAFGAPAKYLGDKSAAYNGFLTFDLLRTAYNPPGGSAAMIILTQTGYTNATNICPCGPVSLTPSADTTLLNRIPAVSMGGTDTFICGTKADGIKTRALLRFDFSQVPSKAVITSASLSLRDSGRQPNEKNNFTLHRLLVDWTEGTNNVGPAGSAAKAGDATWGARMHPDIIWSSPGAASPLDYVSEPSGILFSNTGSIFLSTSNMVADVERWRTDASQNFGWIMICNREDVKSARRFGSRESGESAPRLKIDYLLRPQIQEVEVSSAQFRFSFLQEAGHNYAVEFRSLFSLGSWSTISNLQVITNTRFTTIALPVVNDQRFYRLKVD